MTPSTLVKYMNAKHQTNFIFWDYYGRGKFIIYRIPWAIKCIHTYTFLWSRIQHNTLSLISKGSLGCRSLNLSLIFGNPSTVTPTHTTCLEWMRLKFPSLVSAWPHSLKSLGINMIGPDHYSYQNWWSSVQFCAFLVPNLHLKIVPKCWGWE